MPNLARFRTPAGVRPLTVAAAVALTAGVVVGVALIGKPEPTTEESNADGRPNRCIMAMLDAARSGDADAYLSCFTGLLGRRLEARRADSSGDEFAAELRGSESDLKNFAILDEWHYPSPNEAVAVLERTYSRHNERHRVRLRRLGDGWKITELTPLETVVPRIEYGTPVAETYDPNETLQEGGNSKTAGQ